MFNHPRNQRAMMIAQKGDCLLYHFLLAVPLEEHKYLQCPLALVKLRLADVLHANASGRRESLLMLENVLSTWKAELRTGWLAVHEEPKLAEDDGTPVDIINFEYKQKGHCLCICPPHVPTWHASLEHITLNWNFVGGGISGRPILFCICLVVLVGKMY
jgi:hypothetical protein